MISALRLLRVRVPPWHLVSGRRYLANEPTLDGGSVERHAVELAKVVAAEPDRVWAEMRDFISQARHFPGLAPFVTHANPGEAASDAVGCVRAVAAPGLEGPPLMERLTAHSDAERSFTLTVEAPNALRLAGYSGAVCSTPLSDGSTLLRYAASFDGPHTSQELVMGTYRSFMDSVAAAAEQPEVEAVEVGPASAAGQYVGKLAGRTALVTGGASGIGRAIAEALAGEGARVVIADVDGTAATAVAAALPGGAVAVVDVRSASGVAALFESVAALRGRVDIVVNNAGVCGDSVRTGEHPLASWHSVLDINLNGAFYVLRQALATMAGQEGPRRGVVLNIASTAALAGVPGVPAYTAGKAGLVALTRSTALEYASEGIRVVAIAPTVVETELVAAFMENTPEAAGAMMHMNPLPGLPKPAEVAPAAVFLCSDDALWVSGSVLPVDGAYCAGQKVNPDPLF